MAAVYGAGVLVEHAGVPVLGSVAAVADDVELLGYAVAGMFVLTWVCVTGLWRWSHRGSHRGG